MTETKQYMRVTVRDRSFTVPIDLAKETLKLLLARAMQQSLAGSEGQVGSWKVQFEILQLTDAEFQAYPKFDTREESGA